MGGEPRIGRQCAGVRVSVTLRARFAYDLRSSRVITVCDALVQASAFALPLYPLKQTLLTGGAGGWGAARGLLLCSRAYTTFIRCRCAPMDDND